MAYQPKSYRKFLAGTVTAAVVASAIAPAASAAFSDVPATDSHATNIDIAVEKGLINGFADGSFKPYQDITRGQVAKIIARYLGDVDTTGTEQFTDVAASSDAELAEAALTVRAAGVFNGSNGNLNFAKPITRQEMATVLVRLFELEDLADVDSNVTDLDKAWETHRANVSILAENGITNVTTFNPLGNVKRGQFASFLVRAIDGPEAGELAITNVSALTEDGHVLEVTLNKAITSIDRTDVTLFETASKSRVGVEKVELAKDGKSVTVTLFDNTSDSARPEVERLKNYTITIKQVEFDFVRPGYVDADNNARVTSVNSDKNTIFVNHNVAGWTKTLKVPADFDLNLEEVLGQEIRVWFNAKDEVIDFELEGNTVLYDALEVTETLGSNAGEVKLDQAKDKYDLASNVKFYLNGTEQTAAALTTALTDGKKYDYAKLILDDEDEVAYIYAYTWDESVIVEKVEDGVVYGYDEDLDTEDYVIVKEGKQISVEDIKAGDIVYYNSTADNSLGEDGYIEVFNNTVKGEIEAVYDSSFKVNGKVYDYSGTGFNAQSLDEDGDIQDFRDDEAKEMEGEVTLHLNRNGKVVFVAGEVGEVNTNTSSVILTENIDTYQNNKEDAMFTLEYLTSEGKEELHEILLKDLESITIDGTEYEIDMDGTVSTGDYTVTLNTDDTDVAAPAKNTNNNASAILLEKNAHLAAGNKTIAQADKSIGLTAGVAGTTVKALDNTAIKVEKDDNGKVIGLEFFTSNSLSADIEAGDQYAQVTGAGAKKLTKDTLVYDISDSDPEDIKVYKYSDVAFDIKTTGTATVYYDGNDVEYVVFTDSNASKSEFISTVVTKALYDDSKLVYVKGYVNGVEKEFDVKKLSSVPLVKGDVVVLDYDAQQDLVTAVDKAKTGFELNNLTVVTDTDYPTGVDLSKKKIKTSAGVFTLTADAQVIDTTKSTYEVKALRDLANFAGKITIVRDENNSGYVDTIVIQSGTVAAVAPTAPTATGADNGAADLVLTFSEDLYSNATGTLVADGTVASAFTYGDAAPVPTAGSITSATWATATNTVTFAIANAEDGDTITIDANELFNAVGEAVPSVVYKYVAADTKWVKQ